MSVFRLAAFLGKTVSELDMTWEEFIYWQVYLKLEPPEQAANERTAVVLAQITNMAGKTLPKGRMLSADDFLGKRREQSPDEQIAFMRGLSGA